MRYGFVLPGGDARTVANLARDAEESGWDGFFVCEPIWGVDAWVALTAAAMVTERIRLGTMLTPVSRRRPWKLASETATLDRLSNGRLILAVGLGAPDTGFAAFGEITDRRVRAELLDEGLDIVTGLWRGQPFNYDGKHYTVRETTFSPPDPPVQQPRVPIWVVGAWPRRKSLQRALRYDGLLPNVFGADGAIRPVVPADVIAMRAYSAAHRSAPTPFDIIIEGETPGDRTDEATAIVRAWATAGATWWIEARWGALDQPDGSELVRQRIVQGPPSTGE